MKFCNGGEEVYDQSADPYEWNNLAGDPRFASVCANLSAILPDDVEDA